MTDARQTENQLSDERRQLEHALDEAGTQLVETKLRLSVAESQVTALGDQLNQVDRSRVDTETRLASVVSSLRRFALYGAAASGVTRSRSLSPQPSRSRTAARSPSPPKGRSFCLIERGDHFLLIFVCFCQFLKTMKTIFCPRKVLKMLQNVDKNFLLITLHCIIFSAVYGKTVLHVN